MCTCGLSEQVASYYTHTYAATFRWHINWFWFLAMGLRGYNYKVFKSEFIDIKWSIYGAGGTSGLFFFRSQSISAVCMCASVCCECCVCSAPVGCACGDTHSQTNSTSAAMNYSIGDVLCCAKRTTRSYTADDSKTSTITQHNSPPVRGVPFASWHCFWCLFARDESRSRWTRALLAWWTTHAERETVCVCVCVFCTVPADIIKFCAGRISMDWPRSGQH